MSPRPDGPVRTRAGWATRWLVVLGSLLVTLGLLEALTLAGVDYRGPFGTPVSYEQGPYVTTDPELLFIAKPGVHASGVERGGDIARMWNLRSDAVSEIHWDLRLDANGFRNPDALSRAAVCVIGDSFVVGRPVGAGELLTAVLAERLHVAVANLGQMGYGPQQELLVLKRFAFRYAPSVVVWAVFEGNDLNDLAWYETVREQWPAMVAAEHAFAKRSFVNNAAQAIVRLLEARPEAVLAERRAGVLPDGRHMWFHHEMLPWDEWQRAALEVLGDALADGYGACQQHTAHLVVVFVPDKFRVYRDVCTFPAASECRTWSPNDFPQRLASVVHEISPEIGFLDLTPAFQERARQGELLYFPDDTHWTAPGHALAAETLATFLLHQRYFP